MKKYGKILMAALFCSSFLAGCGSSNHYETTSADMAMEEAYDYDSAYDTGAGYSMATMGSYEEASKEASLENGGDQLSTEETLERKLIRTVNLSVETESFDALLESIQTKVKELDGYVERMDENIGSVYYRTNNYRNASITARIPADRLDAFLDVMAQNSNITYRSESVEDVTLQYVDVQSHLEALRAQQERLLELVEQAETVEELVYLEDQLTEVRYQIQSLESQMRTMNNQISYATVYIDIDEVNVYTPVAEVEKSAWERMGEGFVHSCQNMKQDLEEFFISLVIRLPYILLWGVIILVILLVICKIRRHRKTRKNREKQIEKSEEKQGKTDDEGTV